LPVVIGPPVTRFPPLRGVVTSHWFLPLQSMRLPPLLQVCSPRWPVPKVPPAFEQALLKAFVEYEPICLVLALARSIVMDASATVKAVATTVRVMRRRMVFSWDVEHLPHAAATISRDMKGDEKAN